PHALAGDDDAAPGHGHVRTLVSHGLRRGRGHVRRRVLQERQLGESARANRLAARINPVATGGRMKMLSLLALLPLAAARAEVVDFEGMPIGPPPSGWTFVQTGGGAAAQWEIVADSTAPGGASVLA